MNRLKWIFILSFSLAFIAIFVASERNTTFTSLRYVNDIRFVKDGVALTPESLSGLERVQAEKALLELSELDRYLDLIGPVQKLRVLIVHIDTPRVFRSQPDLVELSWDLFLTPRLLKSAVLKSVVMQFDPEGFFASQLEYETLAAFLLEGAGQAGHGVTPVEKTLFTRSYFTHLDTWEFFCSEEEGVHSAPLWMHLCPSVLRSARVEMFPRWSSLESWLVALLRRTFRDLGWRERLEFARTWLENRRRVRGENVYFAFPSHHLRGLHEVEQEIRGLLFANFNFTAADEPTGAKFQELLEKNLMQAFDPARHFHLLFEHRSMHDQAESHAYFLRLNRHAPGFKMAIANNGYYAFPPGPWLRWPDRLPSETKVDHLIGARCEWPTLGEIHKWTSSIEPNGQAVVVQDCPETGEPLDFYGLLGGTVSSFVMRNINHSLLVIEPEQLDEFLQRQDADFQITFTSRLQPQTRAEKELLGRLEWNPQVNAFEQRESSSALRWVRGGRGEILHLSPTMSY